MYINKLQTHFTNHLGSSYCSKTIYQPFSSFVYYSIGYVNWKLKTKKISRHIFSGNEDVKLWFAVKRNLQKYNNIGQRHFSTLKWFLCDHGKKTYLWLVNEELNFGLVWLISGQFKVLNVRSMLLLFLWRFTLYCKNVTVRLYMQNYI